MAYIYIYIYTHTYLYCPLLIHNVCYVVYSRGFRAFWPGAAGGVPAEPVDGLGAPCQLPAGKGLLDHPPRDSGYGLSMHVCRYVCMSVCLYVCLSVCVYVCMSVCLYVCMYGYAYDWVPLYCNDMDVTWMYDMLCYVML